jgi:hypothetical protein
MASCRHWYFGQAKWGWTSDPAETRAPFKRSSHGTAIILVERRDQMIIVIPAILEKRRITAFGQEPSIGRIHDQ